MSNTNFYLLTFVTTISMYNVTKYIWKSVGNQFGMYNFILQKKLK